MKRVTIITATHNSAATLKYNLLSVAQQNYPFIEQIIIDNQSTDDTLKLLEDFPHVQRVVSEPDAGIYDAINKGIALATGDIIGILNSDDYLADEQVIASIVQTFTECEGADAVYGDLIYVKKNAPNKIQRIWEAGKYHPRKLKKGWMFPHPTMYVKRQVYEDYGLYSTCFKYAADYEMMLRLTLKYRLKFCAIPKVMVYMRAGGATNTSWRARLSVNQEDRMAWERIGIVPPWYTLYLKPLRKLQQFLMHRVMVKWLVHIPPTHRENSFINQQSKQTAKIISLPPL